MKICQLKCEETVKTPRDQGGNECLGFVERALDMRDSEIAILKGDIETFELD